MLQAVSERLYMLFLWNFAQQSFSGSFIWQILRDLKILKIGYFLAIFLFFLSSDWYVASCRTKTTCPSLMKVGTNKVLMKLHMPVLMQCENLENWRFSGEFLSTFLFYFILFKCGTSKLRDYTPNSHEIWPKVGPAKAYYVCHFRMWKFWKLAILWAFFWFFHDLVASCSGKVPFTWHLPHLCNMSIHPSVFPKYHTHACAHSSAISPHT